jgi:hypothetical protein
MKHLWGVAAEDYPWLTLMCINCGTERQLTEQELKDCKRPEWVDEPSCNPFTPVMCHYAERAVE